MTAIIPRVAIASLMTLATLAAPRVAQVSTPRQACDGRDVLYPGPDGQTTGYGNSPRIARNNAFDNGWNEVETAAGARDCDSCPTTYSCTSWDGGWWSSTVGQPVWDPVLKLYSVSVSWENAVYIQRCDPCN
jgi:hypothetical protein